MSMVLDTSELGGEQEETVNLLRAYGAAALKDPLAKAVVWEVMCKWDVVFTKTTAKNISMRKLRPQTIMFELGQDRVRYSHLSILGQYILERCPIWATEDESDIWWSEDDNGNRRREVGRGGVMGALRDGRAVDANAVAILAEHQWGVQVQRPESFVYQPSGPVLHPKDYATVNAPTNSIVYKNEAIEQSIQDQMVDAMRKDMDSQIINGLRDITGAALPAHPAQEAMLPNVISAAGLEIQESTDAMGRHEARIVDKITGAIMKTIRSVY